MPFVFLVALRCERLAVGLEDFVQRLQRHFGNDLAAVVEDFVEQFAGLRAHAEQDDGVLEAAAAFAVRGFAGRRDGVAACRADFAQAAVFFVDAVFALDDEGVVERLVAVQHDLLAGVELEDDVGDALLHVDLQDGKDEVGEVAEGLPGDVAVVETVGVHVVSVGFGVETVEPGWHAWPKVSLPEAGEAFCLAGSGRNPGLFRLRRPRRPTGSRRHGSARRGWP